MFFCLILHYIRLAKRPFETEFSEGIGTCSTTFDSKGPNRGAQFSWLFGGGRGKPNRYKLTEPLFQRCFTENYKLSGIFPTILTSLIDTDVP